MPSTDLRNSLVDQQTTRDLVLHGRKITGASDATAPGDYVTLRQLTGGTTVVPVTLVLAKITGGGTNGSLTLDSTGRITSYVAPT